MGDLIRTGQHDIIQLEQRADENPAAVYLASLSAGSRPAMSRALDVIAQIVTSSDDATWRAIPWRHMRFQHTQAIRSALTERYAHTTVNKMLSALRGTLKAAWRLGRMTAEQYHLAASIENVRGDTVPAGRYVPSGEIAALLDTCDETATDIRDAAVIALLYAGGLRRAEVVGLDLADYDMTEHTMRVRGKGNKQRLVPITGGAADALSDWLEARGDDPGPLFWGTGNSNRHGRLTTQAIYKMLRTRADAAGIPELSPHDLRRTFVSDLLDRGADIATVQRLAGHASVETTARYDRRGERAKRKAAEMLHVPHKRRTLEQEGVTAD